MLSASCLERSRRSTSLKCSLRRCRRNCCALVASACVPRSRNERRCTSGQISRSEVVSVFSNMLSNLLSLLLLLPLLFAVSQRMCLC